MSEAEAAARLQQHHEELCAAAIRALVGEGSLHFRGRRLYRGRERLPLFAPHLHPELGGDDFAGFRGAADGLALRLTRSDAALHRCALPHDPVQRLLFDLLEQFRVEAQVPASLPGVAHNLQHRFTQWSRSFHQSPLAETVRGALLFTCIQLCRARITGERLPQDSDDLLEANLQTVLAALGDSLFALRTTRADQATYAGHAQAAAERMAALLASVEGSSAGDDHRHDAADNDDERAAFGLVMDLDASAADGVATVASGRSALLDGDGGRYRVYTTAYDREVEAATLVRAEQLGSHRERLDTLAAGARVNLQRMARDLQTLLAEPVVDGWDGGQEQGRVDGRRLAQLVASPTERRLFRHERETPRAACVLTLLLDCSGSMRQHAERIAPLADVLARALEMAGVASEVLGFTTGAWNGGRAQRDWLRAGRPPHPGRLNERLHLVFKGADTPWRRARRPLAALLEGSLFREGLDGEAVAWAAARLRARPEPHKLLLVVSDGCPMDAATNLANDAQYLDHHLQDVVTALEAEAAVRVQALGVGLDLSPYYGLAQALDLAAQTLPQVLRQLLHLLSRRPRR